jgi:hypothetical protein
MTARVLAFPPRGPFDVKVEREERAWVVICRRHAWLYGSRHEALADAAEIASGFGVAAEVAR